MRILYIRRSLDLSIKGRARYFLQNLGKFADQDGFFEASLCTAGSEVVAVDFLQYEKFAQIGGGFDAVVVNAKCHPFTDEKERDVRLCNFFKKITCTKALFIGAAKASFMLPDGVIEAVDIVFKREPYRRRDRYNLSITNQQKIVPTMISCPFALLPKANFYGQLSAMMRGVLRPCEANIEFEIGFSGFDACHHTLRRDTWQRIIDEGFTKIGGLQPNPYNQVPVPPELAGPRLGGKSYRNALCAAKINLALKGIGEYTFRHQELLYLGAFMMSDASMTELELPMPLEEGKHYVAFDNLDDMVAKMRYYLEHDDERLKIATAGKQLFDEYYDVSMHGRVIIDSLKLAASTDD